MIILNEQGIDCIFHPSITLFINGKVNGQTLRLDITTILSFFKLPFLYQHLNIWILKSKLFGINSHYVKMYCG
jgi:hypothetical protein